MPAVTDTPYTTLAEHPGSHVHPRAGTNCPMLLRFIHDTSSLQDRLIQQAAAAAHRPEPSNPEDAHLDAKRRKRKNTNKRSRSAKK
ncbi:hypothetical protein ACJ41O_008493 [Fusarium nematophilum]